MNGKLDSVCCMTETFVKERPHTLTGKVEKVGIDDACIFFGKFAKTDSSTPKLLARRWGGLVAIHSEIEIS